MAKPKLSPVEAEKLKIIMRDPVLWAKAFIVAMNPETKKYGPWIARDYQAEILRNRDVRKVYRMGRRLGKCLPGWVKILDPETGELKTVGELYESGLNASVVSMNRSYKLIEKQNCPIICNGEKPVYRVTLKNGKTIDATDNHPLFTVDGWTEIKDLRVGDYIATPSILPFFGNVRLDDNVVKLVAYMIGDGNCKNGNLRFSQEDNKQLAEMKEIVTHFECKLKHFDSNDNPYDYSIVMDKEHRTRYEKSGVRKVLEYFGVYGKGADDKVVPPEFFAICKEQVAMFLSRLFSTDGWATCDDNKGRPRLEIGYCSNSSELVYGISHLLLRFGIRTTVRQKTDRAWELGIYDRRSVLLFAKEIGIFGKEEALLSVCSMAETMNEISTFMPIEINAEIQEKIIRQGTSKADIVRAIGMNPREEKIRACYRLQDWKAKLIAEQLGMTDLANLCGGDIEWQEIKSIESIGTHVTYDLTVPDTHNFVANDIIVHNSECMIVDALWQVCTHKNYRVLFITPYENQVELVFRRMREIIAESPLVKKEVVRIKSSPYTVEFSNGSVILGFTTGAASGSGAASVMGQRADWLFLDELDKAILFN